MELPYLAHGTIGQTFAEQSQDFGYLYDRGQSVAWVKSRWSVGDKGTCCLRRPSAIIALSCSCSIPRTLRDCPSYSTPVFAKA